MAVTDQKLLSHQAVAVSPIHGGQLVYDGHVADVMTMQGGHD
jgi:hypothetical protein